MKRGGKLFLKIALFCLIIAAVAAVAGTLALKRYLPPEKAAALIAENSRKFLRREVKLKAIDLSLISGLTVSGLEVSEPPDFKAGSFARAESFQLRIQLLPLLGKRVVVDKIALTGLDVVIKKGKDGRFNFSDLAGSTAATQAAQAPSQPAGMPLDLAVRQLTLSGGKVAYREGANEVTLSELDATIIDFDLDGPVGADLALKAVGRWDKRPLKAGLEFSGSLDLANLDLARMAVDIRKASLELPEGRLELSGGVKGATAPVVDLKAQWQAGGAEALSAQAAGSLARLDPQDPDVALQVSLKSPAMKSDAFAAWGAPPGIDVPAAEVSSKFRLRGDFLDLSAFSLKAKGVSLDAAGSVREIRAKVPVPDLAVRARIDLPVLTSADLSPLKALKLKVPEGVKLPPIAAEADVQLKGDDLLAKTFKVKTEGAALEASGTLKGLRSAKPQHDLEFSLDAAIPALKSADAAILGALGWPVPQGLELPAASLQAKGRLEGDSLLLRSLRLKTSDASLESAGSIKRLWSGKPDMDVSLALKLDLPALKAADLALLKAAKVEIPATLSLPASKIDAEAHFRGEDLKLKALKVQAQGVLVNASGAVHDVLKAPRPEISASLKLDLPAFTSADVAFLPGVPPNLKIPAAKLEAELSGGPDSAEIKYLRLAMGSNQLSLKGSLRNLKSGKPAYDITMMSKSFVLEELAELSAQTRELKPAGRGSFRLKVAQKPPERPYYIGDLDVQGLGATVAGLKLADFSAKGNFDEKAIDFKRIKGKVDAGNLEMDLTVKNYTKTPSLDIQRIHLDEFDVGKYLAARQALGAALPAPAAEGEAAKPAVSAPPFNFKCRDFTISKVIHPNFTASDASLKWDLYGITPDFKSLDGEAQLLVSSGAFDRVDKLAMQYPMVKVVMIPLTVIQNVAGLGIIPILPNLKHVVFTRIDGDYSFANGKMTLKRSVLDSRAALIESKGTIDLPSEELDLEVNAKIGHYPGVNLTVGGTISSPKAKLGYKKIAQELLKAPLKSLDEPAQKLLDQFFKK